MHADRLTVGRRVIVCIDRFDAADGRVWGVRSGGKWWAAHTVLIEVPMMSVYLGAAARQPRAYLEGVGVVCDDGAGTITIAAVPDGNGASHAPASRPRRR